MMLGMMLPSASPMLLLYARLMRKEREKGAPYVSTSTFALTKASIQWRPCQIISRTKLRHRRY